MRWSVRADDEAMMRLALEEADLAAACGDVPVGAVVVGVDGGVLARARNVREAELDPTGHAEVVAVRRAAEALGRWRLEGATVYATLEPCVMCAGALVSARVSRLVYGCVDPKAGAIDTLFCVGRDPRLNHRFEVRAGVLAEECSERLRAFFADLRARQRAVAADPPSE